MSASVNASASTYRRYRSELVSRDNRINGDPSYSCTVVQRLAVRHAIVYEIRCCCTVSPTRNHQKTAFTCIAVDFRISFAYFPVRYDRETNGNNSRYSCVCRPASSNNKTDGGRFVRETKFVRQTRTLARDASISPRDIARNETKQNGTERYRIEPKVFF